MKKIFVTGTAGFIGYHVTKRLLADGNEVVALDCINDYYDTRVKYARLADLGLNVKNDFAEANGVTFYKANLQDKQVVNKIFSAHKFDAVINLAAQAGVRYQFENAFSYVDSNLAGFVTLLEAVRDNPVQHVIYASSSSVYGLNQQEIFRETDPVDHPMSLYGASKRANELIAHSYSNIFKIPTTGLRFFTVYGPWGRPDMVMYKIADSILDEKELELFERGGKSLWRDYTYVSDIVEGIVRLLEHAPVGTSLDSPNVSAAPYAVYNIGRGEPVENNQVVAAMEEYFGKKAKLKRVEAPESEVFKTFASTVLLEKAIGYKPVVSVKEGVTKFAEWFKEWQERLQEKR